ncbi:hypothetical protein AN478_07370 [Thiohalorhabdus denitrificans]|uniref:Uncharacterized protein n=1 Tax=Thiohalorhabdus denitrificans TaxID=381306 RepID=A0A0P9CTK6_9GAMM|nr:hypothetical protein [Thiohalorhabdus denitrificans]KPV39993.1 hypothetical protein AN478_07370 [Thiohalorhabdus denitrificans]SCY11364.1 hypothetical protein SAMN05661077_1240 [Thiohalorhabdus denitrificans]
MPDRQGKEVHVFLDQTLPEPGWVGKAYDRKADGGLDPLPPLEGVLLSSGDSEEARERASERFEVPRERVAVIQPC